MKDELNQPEDPQEGKESTPQPIEVVKGVECYSECVPVSRSGRVNFVSRGGNNG